ncbi:MAG TPA: hypothetical protein V6C76_01115 [Drouetiella sp.]
MTISIRHRVSLACLAIAFGVPLAPQAFGEAAKATAAAKPAAKTATSSTTSKSAASKTGAATSAKASAAAKPTSAAASTPATAAAAPPENAEEAAATINAAAARNAALNEAVKNYKARPDTATWDVAWRIVHDILIQPATVKASAASITGAYHGLSDLGVSVIDGEGARVWAFPRVPEAQSVILQWNATTSTTVQKPVGRRHKMVSQVTVVSSPRAQVLNVAPGVLLNDAHLMTGAHNLMLSGNVKSSGAVWLQAFKLVENQWTETNDVFAGVPPFLTQNLVGKASFSGNDLVLTIGGGKTPAGKTQPQSSGYKIVLKFADGHYSFQTHSGEDAPTLTALQFVQAVQQGHTDLAKALLADPRLISIPKYIGLGKKAGQPFKLISMANPGPGMFRYRLMTFDKNDLIMDVINYKKAWTVKALFIAPPDPVAQKLVGSLPTVSTEKPAPEKPPEESNK